MLVKGADRHVEPALGALVRDTGGDGLRGPEVGPEEDGEPRAVPGHEEGWSERRPGARGRRVRSGGVRSAGPVDVHAGTGRTRMWKSAGLTVSVVWILSW